MTAPVINFDTPQFHKKLNAVQAMSSPQQNILSYLLEGVVGDQAVDSIKRLITMKKAADARDIGNAEIALKREEIEKKLGPGGIEEQEREAANTRFFAGLASREKIAERGLATSKAGLEADVDIKKRTFERGEKESNIAAIIGGLSVPITLGANIADYKRKKEIADSLISMTKKTGNASYLIGAL
jgi:hypothetical protein